MPEMKNHPRASVTLALWLLPWLLLQGCTVSTVEVTLGSGGHLKNSRGHGTGEVHGVKIEVIDAGGNNWNAGQQSQELTLVGGEKSRGDTITEIELGKVRLTLVESPSGEITLSVDGKGYGKVELGDSVVVDKKRNVAVNDAPRTPHEN